MPYTRVTVALTEHASNYVENNWVHSDETSFMKKHVLARGAYFVLAPTSFITSAIDTIIGLELGIGAISTLGKHEPTYSIADNNLFEGSNKLFVLPYVNFLRAINPEAEFGETDGFFV